MKFARPNSAVLSLAILMLLASWAGTARAQFGGAAGGSPETSEEKAKQENPPREDIPGLVRLVPQYNVWLDPKNKQVVMIGEVALREGPLELLVCKLMSKEHESVLSVRTKAFVVHAALLACGANAGQPVQFRPEYKPPQGTELEVLLEWKDAAGKVQKARGQDWVKRSNNRGVMTAPFVFAGSGFAFDEATNKRYYLAEDGDLICVSNFATATIDVAIESSDKNADLLFEANTEAIPPRGTEVKITLVPKLKKAPQSEDNAESE